MNWGVVIIVLSGLICLNTADNNIYNVNTGRDTSVGIFTFNACENFALYGSILDRSEGRVSGTSYLGHSNLTKLISIPNVLTTYCTPNWMYMTCNIGLLQVISGDDCSRDFEAFTYVSVRDSFALLAENSGMIEIPPGQFSASAGSGSGSAWVMESFGTLHIVAGLPDSTVNTNQLLISVRSEFASFPFVPGQPDGTLVAPLHQDNPLTTWFLRCGGEVFCGAMLGAFQTIDEHHFMHNGLTFDFLGNFNWCHVVSDAADAGNCWE